MAAKEEVIALLAELRGMSRNVWDHAHSHRKDDPVGTARNVKAEEAARNYRDSDKRLLVNYQASGDADQLLRELRALLQHAEERERHFQDPRKYILTLKPQNMWPFGLFKYGYVQSIHGDAAGRYRDCLQKLESMDLRVRAKDGPASSTLHMLFGNEGDVDGTYEEEVEVKTGYTTTCALDATMLAEVYAKAEASKDVAVAKMMGETGGKFATELKAAATYERCESRTRRVKFIVKLGQPCYMYQVQTTVGLTNNKEVTLYGGYFISKNNYS